MPIDTALDAPLAFENLRLSPKKELVRKFYKDLWDHGDTSLIPDIFHEDFSFRGSLGPTLRGYGEFARYVDWVTGALGDYTTDILDMIEDDHKVSCKVRFHGIHRAPMFGFRPTGKHVWWYGAPVFTFEGDRVLDLWVLGDIYGLLDQMGGETKDTGFANS